MALCAARHEMHDEQYEADDQNKMNESGCYVKCEKTQQPKNDQYSSDNPKHFYLPASKRDSISAPELPNRAKAYSHAGEL
jgi:hypothetical protein